MTVTKIETVGQFKETIASNAVVLVDWFATWCGPCKAISPIVEKMSEDALSISFIQVDVDEVGELAEEYGIRAMPTFHIFKDGEKVEEFVGADPSKLQALIQQYQ